MGIIFDKDTALRYDAWCHSPTGRAVDKSIEQLFLALLDPGPRERLLDIGCGGGNHLLTFNKLGLDVSGVDASPHMINKARERLGHRCTLKTGMAEDLPFDDNEFDLSVLINTLEFLDNPIQALREAGRVTNRKVFIGVINSLSWHGFLKKIQGYLGDPLFSHARFYNLWQLKSIMEKAFGHIPISWSCIRRRPSFIGDTTPFAGDFWGCKHSPIGCFLGVSATMAYRIKADSLPLKIRFKKVSQSLVGIKALKDYNQTKGVPGDERGIPV